MKHHHLAGTVLGNIVPHIHFFALPEYEAGGTVKHKIVHKNSFPYILK